MTCPSCGQREGRRACPALGQTICTVCCATKRLVEINCPPDCVHLVAAREHPAASVKRQQERDIATLLPTIRTLTERQHQLFFVFHTAIARHAPEGFAKLSDDDVAQAAGAVAATLETSARGVIYEHAAHSLVARRLAGEMQAMVAQIREQGATVSDREVATTLRVVEQGVRVTRKEAASNETAYLEMMGRLMRVNRAAQAAESPATDRPASSIILP